ERSETAFKPRPIKNARHLDRSKGQPHRPPRSGETPVFCSCRKTNSPPTYGQPIGFRQILHQEENCHPERSAAESKNLLEAASPSPTGRHRKRPGRARPSVVPKIAPTKTDPERSPTQPHRVGPRRG